MCEKSLILDVKSNKSEKAFGDLISIYEKEILGFLRNKTAFSSLDPQEVYNKVLLKIWNNISSFREDSSFKTWAFQITKNTLYREFSIVNRKEKNEIPLGDYEDQFISHDSPESEAIKVEDEEILKQKIKLIKSSLSKNYRKVFELRFEQGKSQKEISQILDCSFETVRSRLFLIRKKIHQTIEKYEYRRIS
jgi:RNA polymerase sigma-70 factor, ECF subfamily